MALLQRWRGKSLKNFMNEDFVILNSIREICANKPHLLPKIIDYATAGVKEFAEKQSDKTTKMSFIMTQVLDEIPDKKQIGAFSRKEILDRLESLHGTTWHQKELDRLKA